jgi:hypothetical protein
VYNSTYKKLAVQWLNEALCFVSRSVVTDNFVLRNRQLLVAANRYAQYRADKLDHAHWHICLPLKSFARPKQAKEPTFPDPRTKDQEILKKSLNSHKNRVG